MPGVSVFGAQWGDEGKGRIVDFLANEADVVLRYQGGNNAGHTIIVDGVTYTLHLLPAGLLYEGKLCVIGNGVVVDPGALIMKSSWSKTGFVRGRPDDIRQGAHGDAVPQAAGRHQRATPAKRRSAPPSAASARATPTRRRGWGSDVRFAVRQFGSKLRSVLARRTRF